MGSEMCIRDRPSAVSRLLVLFLEVATLSEQRWSTSHERRRSGNLHATKECSQFTGKAGSFCTITDSNVGPIKVSSKVYYDQAAGIPADMLDSNVVLDAGGGNRAFGRCSIDSSTGTGLCTFSDGTGQLAGFHARVKVDCTSVCRWDGTYRFSLEH